MTGPRAINELGGPVIPGTITPLSGWTKFGHYYLQRNYRICMKLLPETCLRSWDRLLHFVNDPDYDPDSGSGLLSGSLGGGLHFLAVLGVIVHVFWKINNIFHI